MNVEINKEDIEYINEPGNKYYVFWKNIHVGSIQRLKKTNYMPSELVGKWAPTFQYKASDCVETKALAAINSVKKYLQGHPDRINGAKESDLQEAEKFKEAIDFFRKIRQGDYGPERNGIKQDFEQWCINNDIGDEKFRSKVVTCFMGFILSLNTWAISRENQEYAQYIVNIIFDFQRHLISHGVSIRTYRQHSENLSILGFDILKKRNFFSFDMSEFKDYFLQDIQMSSKDPPDFGYVDVEGRNQRFRSACKKLSEFICQEYCQKEPPFLLTLHAKKE